MRLPPMRAPLKSPLPFFGYYGGKFRAAPHYPAPLHKTIIEPFAGSAGYAMRHYERQVILIEKYAAYEGIADMVADAESAVGAGVHDRASNMHAKEEEMPEDDEQLRATAVESMPGFDALTGRCKSCGHIRELGSHLGGMYCGPCFNDLAAGRAPLCRDHLGPRYCTKPAMHPIAELHSDGKTRW